MLSPQQWLFTDPWFHQSTLGYFGTTRQNLDGTTISSSRPITGSNLPASARSVKSMVVFIQENHVDLHDCLLMTFSSPRIFKMTLRKLSALRPLLGNVLVAPLRLRLASQSVDKTHRLLFAQNYLPNSAL